MFPAAFFFFLFLRFFFAASKWANNNQSISLSEQILLILDQLFKSLLPADSSRVASSKSSSRLSKVANLHGNDRCQRGATYRQSIVPFSWRYYMFGPLNVVILVERTHAFVQLSHLHLKKVSNRLDEERFTSCGSSEINHPSLQPSYNPLTQTTTLYRLFAD
jgi:hypothetical protein